MVAAVSGAASTTDSRNNKIADERTKRTPLLPSEKDNNNGAASNQRKPKSMVVSSRYMSPSASTSNSSSMRCPSPSISKNSTPIANAVSQGQKRSVSVDRRRPAAARPLIPDLDSKQVSAAAKMLVTSTRRLSVSFQGESFSLPVSKAKIAPSSPNSSILRKGTPGRRRPPTAAPLRGVGRDQFENSRPGDQHRWPAMNRLVNQLARSLDCGNSGSGERSKVMGSGNAIRLLQQSMMDDGTLNLELGSCEPIKAVPHGDSVKNVVLPMPNDLTISDTDSVLSSGSTSGVQDCGDGASHARNLHHGKVVSSRFWQETSSRLRRLQDPGSTLLTSPGSKLIVPPKLKKYPSDGLLSFPRTVSSTVCGGVRSASPSKLMTPSRGHSPSRIKNVVSTISNNFVEMPSVLSFSVDVRRGKVGENRIDDAHLLRLVYNRHLQWRFANASAEAVLLVQKHNAEKNLWNAWITISDLRDMVTKKRHRLQLLKQKLKLASILKGQMTFLEDWASLENSLSTSLLGAIEALKASTLRLPLVGGATADVQSLKETIGSCFDVMQAIESVILPHLPVVEEVNSLTTELAKVTANKQALLEQCTECVTLLAGMQIRDSSLRAHIIQQSNSVQSTITRFGCSITTN